MHAATNLENEEVKVTTTTTPANQLYHNSFTLVPLSNSNTNGYGNNDDDGNVDDSGYVDGYGYGNTSTKTNTNDSTNANSNINGSLLN
ncbi:hypothetical protein PoB_004374700 [Plakobranchus ocellatus]|uniref:Uncharacterized protein n=1 Tax=Plakobranchus ocellatus TaxID=259542 RepID=A0AAV4BCQ9_9GAST|nr:hypothetical protein PoB_004374700 [Plakobranchus ocellatus]